MGEKKTEMVNSILETTPEAEKKDQKEILESMDLKQLGVIVNSLPNNQNKRGIPGGNGTGRENNSDEYTDEKFKADYKAAYGEDIE